MGGGESTHLSGALKGERLQFLGRSLAPRPPIRPPFSLQYALLPGHANTPVTNDNRLLYCHLLVRASTSNCSA